MRITFSVKREVVYEFTISGATLGEIAAEVRRLKREEDEDVSRDLFDLMTDGTITTDTIGTPRIVRRED